MLYCENYSAQWNFYLSLRKYIYIYIYILSSSNLIWKFATNLYFFLFFFFYVKATKFDFESIFSVSRRVNASSYVKSQSDATSFLALEETCMQITSIAQRLEDVTVASTSGEESARAFVSSRVTGEPAATTASYVLLFLPHGSHLLPSSSSIPIFCPPNRKSVRKTALLVHHVAPNALPY